MQPKMISAADALSEARRWYEAQVDAVTRAWEQRFRFRQYRPHEEGDCEERASPVFELEDALEGLPILEDDAAACLVLAVSPQEYEDAQPIAGQAAVVMALDVLQHAERLGYFDEKCSDHVRFPDLPERGVQDRLSDLELAQEEATSAVARVHLAEMGVKGYEGPIEQYRAAALAAEERVTGMKAGTVAALSREQKDARHEAQRRQLVADYRDRLARDGMDVRWIEIPSSMQEVRRDDEE